MKKLTVYILECGDSSYYVGITSDIKQRINQHNEGVDRSCYTYPRRPVRLLFTQDYSDYSQALVMERRLKGWSRKKKEALIKGDYNSLKELAKSKGKTNHKITSQDVGRQSE